MAATVINVVPAGQLALGPLSSTAITVAATATSVKLSFKRTSWPVMAIAAAPVVRAQCWVSYDGAATWSLLAGFTAAGGSISATESAVRIAIKPQKNAIPRQIRMTGNVFSVLGTQIDFTVA